MAGVIRALDRWSILVEPGGAYLMMSAEQWLASHAISSSLSGWGAASARPLGTVLAAPESADTTAGSETHSPPVVPVVPAETVPPRPGHPRHAAS